MTRQEVEAWGLVGAGAVIIVLLLLDYAPMQPAQNVSITEAPAGPPNQYSIEVKPPIGTPLPPWQIVFPPIPTPEFNLIVAQPCSCSCSEVTEIQGQQFAAQVDALNQMFKNETISNEAAYFSEMPYQNLFATNATGIAAFTSAVGLPNPIPTQNVTTPGNTPLVGGGDLSYTFASANPFGG